MSFPCVLGMQEGSWEDGSYPNGTAPKHPSSIRSTNGGQAKNTSYDVVAGKSNGEVASYLFQRQGVASSFPKTVGEKEEGFGGRQWPSVERMADQNDEDNEELEGKFQGMTLNNNEKKADTPIEEIATAAKKLWDVQDSGEEKTVMSTGILHGDQWHENTWGPSVPHMNQSEHAVSQPIMVQHSVKRGSYNSNNSELHGVLSPRSADGVGLSMVEYVLGSSPGGQELESQMIKAGYDGEDDHKSGGISKASRVSPFEEETPEELQQALHREQELNSPKAKSQQGEEDVHSTFSRTPGSRDPSPTTSSSQHSQDALQSNQAPISNASPIISNKPRNQAADFREIPPSSISLDPVTLEQLNFENQHFPGTPLSPSEVVMVSGGSLPGSHSFSGSSLQHLSPQQIALAVAAQHQQQQQQLQSAMAQQNPYYLTATQGQDMYGSGSLPQVNPAAQIVTSPYAPAAYSIQPWGVYPGANVSGNGNFMQQQQQQQQQQQSQPQQQQQQQQHPQLLRSTSNPGQQIPAPNQLELMNSPQQASMAANTNYQLLAPPGAPPLGLGAAAYYDQSGNLVLSNAQGINGVSPQQLAANQMGGPLRMMSPMVLNAANGNANTSAGRMGNSGGANGMRMFGQQAQQQMPVSGPNSMNSYQNQVPMNGNAVGVVGNNLGILGGSSNVGAVGSMGSGSSRRDVMNTGEYSAFNKRQAIQGYYPSLGGALTVSAPPSYNSPQELPTPPLLSQGSQSGFSVGSPISSGLSRYMQLAAAPDKKYQNSLNSLNGSPFGNSVLTQGSFRGGRLKDTGRSRLLEDFRNNRYPNIQLRDLANHIVEFSQDQHGSRFIQQKLERASPVEKNMVFHEILPAAYSLMTDVFGNYVIQKFFEFGSEEQKHHLASCIRGNVLPLALQMYGCRVIQKALECLPPNVQIKHDLVMELDGHVLKCVKDQNGNHVVQKCIECVDPHALQFIIDAFKGQVYALSTHPYGCRVIQRILEHCLPEQTMPILGEMHDQTERLVQDQYGNYVIQHVLEHGTPEDRNKIVMQLRGNILPLSQHKFASNVVEKCVSFASRAERALLIDEVCNTTDAQTQQSALYIMMKDQFANYVVQKMIDVAEPVQRKVLMHRIRPHVPTLRKYTYGKHILAKLDKYYMTVKPTPDFLPLANGQLL